MRPAERSVAVYGAYLAANGMALLFSPELPVRLLGLPEVHEPWARLFGLVVGELGCYFVFAARREFVEFCSATVYGRTCAAAAFLVIALLKLGPPQLALLAAIDLASAMWTHLSLGKQEPA